MDPITRLPSGVPDLIQSTISLPTYPSILAELIHNAIDAKATQIDCWINPSSSSLRVTDNGCGINKEDLKSGLGCERGMTSKRGTGRDQDHALGFRGQALASMGTIALVEIISRRQGFATTYHKAIKNGKALSCGPTERHARPNPGTTVILKDLYHSVPVRRIASKGDSAASIVQACTKLVESIILSFSSNPNTPIGGSELAITLTLEGDAAAGIPSRRVLSLKSHSDPVMTYSNIFGSSLTASTKSFRASARGIHLRGFVSFTGHPTKAHQYLFVNGHRIAQSGIMDVVREVYRIANVLAQEMDEEEIGPRGGKKVVTKTQNLHPVFLLHLSLPEDEMDLGMEPLKSIVLFKDEAVVQKVVKSTMKNVLASAGYLIAERIDKHHRLRTESLSSAMDPSAILTARKPLQPSVKPNVTPQMPMDAFKRYSMPAKASCTGSSSGHRSESSNTSRPEWLSKALSVRAQQVFPVSKAAAQPRTIRTAQQPEQTHDCGRADGSVEDFGLERLQLCQEDLFTAKVVAQIDNKFICCAIRSKDDPQSTVLVLVDQHAADERVRVERFLREVLDQFKAGGVTSMALEDDAYDVQITKEQHDFLVNHPAATELLERWGFRISSSQASGRTGTATAVIDSVPTLLLSRLGAKGAREVTKIVSGYIAFLQTQPIGRMASLLNGGGAHSHSGLDTTGLLRWIPRRMKELVDSKACRGAIMFNDPLTLEKCSLLIRQLGQTSFPFICAHGRPSIYPLVRLAPQSRVSQDDSIVWKAVTLQRWFPVRDDKRD